MSEEEDLHASVLAAMDKDDRDLIGDDIEQGTLFDKVSVPKKANPVREASVPWEALEDDVDKKYRLQGLVMADQLATEAGHFELPKGIDPDIVKTFDKLQAKNVANSAATKTPDVRMGRKRDRDERHGKDPSSTNIGLGAKRGKTPRPNRTFVEHRIPLTFPALGMYCWYLAGVHEEILYATYVLLWQFADYEFYYTDQARRKTTKVNAATFLQLIYKVYVKESSRKESSDSRQIALHSDEQEEILAEMGYALLAPYVFEKKQRGLDALNRQFGRLNGKNALFQNRCAKRSDSAMSRFLQIAIQDSTKLSAHFINNLAIKSILQFANKTLKTSHKEYGTAYYKNIEEFYNIATTDTNMNLHKETAIIARIAYIEAVLKANNTTGPDLLTGLADDMKNLVTHVENEDIRDYFIDIVEELTHLISEKYKELFKPTSPDPYVLFLRLRIT